MYSLKFFPELALLSTSEIKLEWFPKVLAHLESFAFNISWLPKATLHQNIVPSEYPSEA